MIRPRRSSALLIVASMLLAGCGGGDLVDGSGTSAARSGGFPSTGAPTGASTSRTDSSASAPTSGGSSASALVDLRSLTGNATTVQLDPAFVKALTALTITPGLLGTARLTGSAIAFPVTGGSMSVYAPGASPIASGSVEHAGSGFTLAAGSTMVSLTNLRIDVGSTPQVNGTASVNGKVVVQGVTLFDVDDASVSAIGSTGAATVSGLSLRTDSGLADLLNKSFGTTAFTSGLVLGTATLALTGR